MKPLTKIFIAGGSGFIGKSLIDELNEDIIIGAASRKKINIKKKNLFIYKKDLSQRWNIDFSPDVIIFSLQGKYKKGKKPELEENFNSQILALRNCIKFYKKKKCKLIIFFSSMEVYGKIKTRMIDENTSIYKPNFYGATKFFCENILEESSDEVNSLILRLPGIVGNKYKPRCWLYDIKNRLDQNKPVNYFKPNNKFNNIFDIKNLVKFLEIIFKNKLINKFDILNLGAKKPLTINKLIKISKEKRLSSSLLKKNDLKKNSYEINIAKLINKYKFNPDSTEKMLINFMNK